ncbi:MAG: ATP-dependent DNA helicase RecG [Erysipelotrichaceae bacterium]|nr:ATP-dependent DNA helicase RecG [Erysipelotrichaceae bacterium]
MKLLTSSKNAEKELNLMGIYTSEDLISYLPYKYESFEYCTKKEYELVDKERVVLLGRLVSNPKFIRTPKIDIIKFFFISEEGSFFNVVVYNRPYLTKMLNLEDHFTLVGTYNLEKKELNLINIKKGEIPKEERLKGVYHLPNQIQSSYFSKLMKRTLESMKGLIGNVIPDYLVSKYKLLNHEVALNYIHFPKNEESVKEALRTLKFEECLEYCLKNKIVRKDSKKKVKTDFKDIDTNKINEFIKHLSYKLTKDQIQAVKEIILDMKKDTLMYRLLQGDVGTGKTLVAGISLFGNFLRGMQGVILAPTDSLARQHFASISRLFKDYNINVELLVGSLSNKEKKDLILKIKEGKVDVIVGTHAVFSKDVEYSSLGLVIIDEQHRFGVNQRNLLVSKGNKVDLLLMSATPIPRTLSLSIYGDLDVSSLVSFPSGIRNVKTMVVDESSSKIEGLIDYCLKKNSQVFIVCPKIETSYRTNSLSVKEVYDLFKDKYQNKIGMLHGKLKEDEKIKLIEDFREKRILILVSTSIIELGIDIKGATGMIIYSSNNFGLASLHQLRGRVGRSGNDSFCLLVSKIEEDENIERLKFLETCSDGFEISEEDMRLRGPGDFAGLEQSGFPSFNCLNIVSDFKMFEVARDEVSFIMNNLDNPLFKKYYSKIKDKMNKNHEEIKLFD